MAKERLAVAASALGSYFGVGFNHPIEQLMIDLGELDNEFDEDAQFRMDMGNILEDASLNLLEHKLSIIITNRNVEVHDALNGMLRIKMDGETVLNSEPTVVENKISNSKSYKFTENLGYIIQCQAYMLHTGYKQALLGGLYRGELIYKIITRDEELIADITEMTTAVYGILNGILSQDDYPWHIVDKYKRSIIQELDVFDSIEDVDLLENLAEYGEELRYLEAKKKELTDYLTKMYNAIAFQNDDYKLTISSYERKGNLNVDVLNIEYPDIDLSKYYNPPSVVKTVRVTKRKVA